MSKEIAKNVFTNGLQMDVHPLNSQNTILSNSLNATFITVDGDELVLQNDFGNLKIKDANGGYVKLTDGFIPIGVNTYNGIAYIVSYNPNSKEGEIGTYPSPNYNLTLNGNLSNDNNDFNTLIDSYKPLYNLQRDGKLYPLRTDKFNFSLNYPVNVEIQKSYDGSINLILNDNFNIPRLINTRFSVLGNGKWEIPERRRNESNIYKDYDQTIFDITTSLHKRISSFPIVKYNGVLDTGDLPVGNYVLYFKYCDEDENETDFIAESGIISIFKGKDSDPFSIDGGERDMDSNKSINITLQLIDSSYSYVKVYYSRTSAAADENRISSAYKISKLYPISNGECDIIITGNEEKITIPTTDLNQPLTIVNSAKTQTQVDNILFMGNISEQETNYKQLTDLSLHIIPYVEKQESKDKIGYISCQDYSDTSGINPSEKRHIFKGEYYNTKNIYYNVGYWNEEFYRLGIVYIYKDGSLSPVFNILGYESQDLIQKEGISERFSFKDTLEIDSDGYVTSGIKAENVSNINSKGIIKINDEFPEKSYYENKNWLYNIGVYISSTLIEQLQNLDIQGFFIVRQKRIPTILAQGYTLPWDKESKVPIVQYFGKGLLYSSIDGFSRETSIDNCEDYKWYLKKYNEPAIYKEGPFLWHNMYFVESFIQQVGKEGDTDNGVNADPVKVGIPQYQKVTHEYIPRLYNILPTCIDSKMIETDDEGKFLGDGYTHKSYSEGESSSNYYYTDSVIDKYTGYIIQNENSKGENDIHVDNYYGNRLLIAVDADATDKRKFNNEAVNLHYYNLYKYCDENQLTAICPEFEVRQPFFNQLFTGSTFTVRYSDYQQGVLTRNPDNERQYYPIFPGGYETNKELEEYINKGATLVNPSKEAPDFETLFTKKYFESFGTNLEYKIVGVTENVPIVAIDNTIFKGVCGNAQEAFRFEYINEEHSSGRGINLNDDQDFNFVRGVYAPYLGIIASSPNWDGEYNTEKKRGYCRTFNIYNDQVNNSFRENYKIRKQNNSSYYPISERIAFNIDYTNYIPELKKDKSGYTYDLYRGDCFLCTFTHRLNRNFNDPTAPSNDKIIDGKTWRDHYDIPDGGSIIKVEDLEKINRGDTNAVKLGSWITIKVKSSYNLSIRSLDERYLEEKATMGRARGFYPLQQASAEGGYKIPNSYLINDGFGSTVGEKIYETLPEAPYYNDRYQNRIVYSDINIIDSYKNNYRIIRQKNSIDYTKQYGQIIKLVPILNGMLCVFEHGIAYIPVNEKALITTQANSEIYIDSKSILPDTPTIISDKFGSQWADSIISTPYFIYGVDTSTQKIWRTNGKAVQIISDLKIERFLKENLIVSDNDSSVDIGLKNVKSHYNQNKSDVMFTFYVKNSEDEIAWNLCLNEASSQADSARFTTFYSWIPLESFTLNNVWYTFDRDAIRGYRVNNIEEIPQYIWKHNNSVQRPLPTHWYGKQHPFEFEFIVADKPETHKIFENMQILSNMAEPESFHFEITGDSYEFKNDFPNMYYRQEATKELFHNLGSHWTFEDYTKIYPNQNLKSTIFPLYYERKDEYDQIYDNYQQMTDTYRNYQNLSGSEIVWNKRNNEFYIATHIKNLPINGHWVRDSKGPKVEIKPSEAFLDDSNTNWHYSWESGGVLRGNSWYDKDKWNIQIPSITFMQKNESPWNIPPIVLNSIPKDIKNQVISYESLPNTYSVGQNIPENEIRNNLVKYVQRNVGWTNRKETKIQDKYCRIKIRYSGEQLATILAVLTYYNTK